MAARSSALLRLLCLCNLLALALPARPANITIGALFTFDSVIGRSARAAIQLAVDDVNRDAAVLKGTQLSVVSQDSKCSGFVGTIQALQLMEKNVVAVVGPQSSGIAHVVNELHVPLLSFAATDPALASSSQYSYFVRTTHDDSFQMVSYYGWREVTAIYVDNDYGRGGVDALGDALEAKRAKISYKAPFAPDAVGDLLLQVSMMESRVCVVHVSPDSGLAIFAAAQSLGMMASGYVWIATDWLAAALGSGSSRRAQGDGPHPGRGHAPPVQPGLRRQAVARGAVRRPERERGDERLRAGRLRHGVDGGARHRPVPRPTGGTSPSRSTTVIRSTKRWKMI